MKRSLLLILFGLWFNRTVLAQTGSAESIKLYRQKLALYKNNDSTRVKLLTRLSNSYRRNNYDSALFYARKALVLAKQIGFANGEVGAELSLEYSLRETGNLAEALNLQLDLLAKARLSNNVYLEGVELNSIGNTYLEMGDFKTALDYYRRSRMIMLTLPDNEGPHIPSSRYQVSAYYKRNEASNMGNVFEKMNQLDSALRYETAMYHDKNFPIDLMPELLSRLGALQLKLGKEQEAMQFFRKGIVLSFKENTVNDRAIIYYQMAVLFKKMKQLDSSLYYAHQSFYTAKSITLAKVALDASLLIAELYHKNSNLDSAYAYQQVAIEFKDALFGADKFSKIQLVLSQEQQRQDALKASAAAYKDKVRFYMLVGVLLVAVLIASILWYSNKARKRANYLLQEQKEEIATQRDNLEQAYSDLQLTQSQLVQREKMASLGELTAGIAHEIQNPLNFVNNFSDVNQEMLAELRDELNKGDIEEAKVIAADIEQNEGKINYHGKRADAIVKGMLQHSRISSGPKEPTDINALADEYLRLAFHGLRAKDKSFNAELVNHFEEKVPKVEAVPQELGRVLLNLFSNAFYAVQQKAKTAGPDYKPTVQVSTTRQNSSVFMSVKDNGVGIPDAIKDKIMQPFFTTKPTGEGIGLGLSLSYDIVVKGHGGKIEVDTEEGEYTEIKISFPV